MHKFFGRTVFFLRLFVWFSLRNMRKYPLRALTALLFLYSTTLFFALPIVAPLLYVQAWLKSFSSGLKKPIACVGAALVAAGFSFF